MKLIQKKMLERLKVENMENNFEDLKEKVKKGTVSYFSLTKEEIHSLSESFKSDIENDMKEIENIRKIVQKEKERLQSNK